MTLGLLRHVEKLDTFVSNTTQYIAKSSEPGGYYTATWMRDASYILKDQFISGYISQTIEELKYIWSNQIDYNTSRLIYGRGSPSNNFTLWVTSPNSCWTVARCDCSVIICWQTTARISLILPFARDADFRFFR